MPFITWSQNFEDLMLDRALRHIPDGFYVDLGAAEPELHSVTKTFYDRGWHGINVEPGAEPFGRLEAARTRDVNLNVAAWNEEGSVKFYSVDDGCELSTTSEVLMHRYKAAGRTVVEKSINVTTLTGICAQYVPNGQDIHFMKVDVEGSEQQALAGHDFTRWRPWIVLVECHEPERSDTQWHAIEGMMIMSGYTFVWCDGLNRFYIANEKLSGLRHAFEVPPNVHDDWVKVEQVQLEYRLRKAEALLGQTME